MKLRIFWGWVTGTVLSLALFGWFATLNGTPVPSAHTPAALIAYPTGSVTDTLVIVWVVYFACLLVSCVLIPRKPKEPIQRKPEEGLRAWWRCPACRAQIGTPSPQSPQCNNCGTMMRELLR